MTRPLPQTPGKTRAQHLRILRHAGELKYHYLGITLVSVLIAVTALLTPFVVRGATDEVVAGLQGGGGGVRVILYYAIALLVVEVLNTVLRNIGGFWGDMMAARLRAILSGRYYDKLLRLPQRYFDNTLSGTVIARLNRSITEITNFLNSFANNFLPMLITLAAVLGISAFYSWPLAVALIVIFPVYTWLTTMTSPRWQALEKQKNAHVDTAGGAFAEVVGQIKVVKSFATEQRELRRFNREYASTIGLTRRQSSWWHSMDVLRNTALALIFFVVHAIILVKTVQGDFSVGTMVMLLQLVTMAKQPVTGMSWIVDTAQRAIAGSVSYFEVMDEVEESTEMHIDQRAVAPLDPVTPGQPVISLRDASFGYSDSAEDVLSGVSFEVMPGEKVALVGESGGGKTTIVNLLLGLYPLREGSLTVLGRDHSRTDLAELRRSIGVVFQEPALFSGTIRDNITYGRPDATDEQVVEVATRANAHQFINGFRDDYDSVIGERGLKLSGGQRQRIAVARAMLKDAPILVLDEATSALDTRSERLVQEGLDVLMENRTSIIIAHRLSTIAAVDRIVTLRDGKVDEIGTPAELAVSGGIYSELLALQAEGGKRNRKRLQSYDISG
ncbi:ABC transporter ATP-binding protein [Aestuariimicrobium ganziense]|uniref:ABC transporter ATP-binding protein n=1 Tax=Aestuariimicrobium ganziense TaxID=2773677 RepID=UPI0019404E98|nr:ABC transporter ATP-binding protein [Aestuariimicrobium ganziense]